MKVVVIISFLGGLLTAVASYVISWVDSNPVESEVQHEQVE